MPTIPSEGGLDSTRAFLRDPYRFIGTACARHRSDLFQARLALSRLVCMTGPEATKLFYDPELFTRAGAAPGWLRHTLFGDGGVQGLDGQRHRHRKQLFTGLTDADRVGSLAEAFAARWRDAVHQWVERERVPLYDELCTLLTTTTCRWAGVPLPDADVPRRTRELTAMFEGAGTVGRRHLEARAARRSAQHWIEDVIAQIRARKLDPTPHTAAYAVAWYRDPDGALLAPRVAAVELLNVLRPTVANAVYLTFVAHALRHHPRWREKLELSDNGVAEAFVQEIRRSYPFFPAVLAVTRSEVRWRGYRIPPGTRTALDIYGTNHDSRTWTDPERFDPDRFLNGHDAPASFIPQGGGEAQLHHRCPGEPITIELMKVAIDVLARYIDYELPEQDLRIDYRRLPALPRSGMVLGNVKTYD